MMRPTPLVGVVLLLTASVARGHAATIPVRPSGANAIAAAIASSEAGDVIEIGAGTYVVTRPIAPKSATKLVGAGEGKTILRFGGEAAGALIDLSGLSDVDVAHLTLDGADNPRAEQGIFGTRARRLNIHDVTVRNLVKGEGFGPHGIHFTGEESAPDSGVTDSVISHCTFQNIGLDSRWGAAIRLSYGSSRNRVVGNRIDGTGRGGIFCDNRTTDTVIDGNIVTGSSGEALGIEVNGHCDRSVIEDNRIDHWISVSGCALCAVRRNEVRDESGTVEFCGVEGIGQDLVVTDNRIGEGQQIGISISESADHCLYAYNTVRQATEWGAQLDGDITRQYFYRCAFADTPGPGGEPIYPGSEGNGFRSLGNVRSLVLEDCQFVNNSRAGVQLLDEGVDGLDFRRCVIEGNKQRAVEGPTGYSSLVWEDCQVEGNGDNALPASKPFPQAPPTAAFDAPEAGRTDEPVAFVSTSHAASGGIASLLWDFGDGVPATEPQATHTYRRAGTYRVTLIAWDAAGRAARAERQLRITCAEARSADQRRAAPPRGDTMAARHTEVSIRGESFCINGHPTYEGRVWNGHKVEGLLMNSRMVQGIFDDLNPETRGRWAYPDTGGWDPDRNTQEFMDAMPSWRQHGLLAFSLNLQGGNPGRAYDSDPQTVHNSAWTEDGQLRPDYEARLRRVLDRADELGMVVILGLFYFGQDGRLRDETAVRNACHRAANWVLDEGYTNVLIEINNECDTGYGHDILKPDRVHELIEQVRGVSRDGRRLLVGTSYGGGAIPGESVLLASDFILLHGNFIERPERIAELVRETRALPAYRPMPILFNEDDHYDFDQPMNNMVAAVREHASWGYHDKAKGDERDGYRSFQSPPVDWAISTDRRKAFFDLVREITGT